MVDVSRIKELREKTGAGMMDSKKALVESKGDIKKAIIILREKGLAGLSNKSDRKTTEGVIDAYVHSNGKIGVLVEVNCETDFVAKNKKFVEFAHNIALQIAASNPGYISEEEVDEKEIKEERKIYAKQVKDSGKPNKVIDKIVDGKMNKFYEEVVLLEQEYVKDSDMKVKDYLGSIATSLGENIKISNFFRMELGK